MNLIPIIERISETTKTECIQLLLAKGENNDVKSFLAYNHYISHSVQLILFDCDDVWVSHYLRVNPNVSERIKLDIMNRSWLKELERLYHRMWL